MTKTDTSKTRKPARSSAPARAKPAAQRAAAKAPAKLAPKSIAAKKPAAKSAAKTAKPAARSTKPVARSKSVASPAKRPLAAKPVAKSAAKPVAKPVVKPVAKPAAAKSAAPRKPKKAALPSDPVERLRVEVKRALEDLKARDITEIDVRGKTSIADYLVVASGTSNRHVKSIAEEVIKNAKASGSMPLGVEGQREAEWVLVDLGDIVVHVMLPRVREFYGLERLWSVGAEQIEAMRA